MLLPSCQTSSSGAQVANEAPPTLAIKSFDDGSGVLRAEMGVLASGATGKVNKLVAITPDISKWVSDLSASELQGLIDHNLALQDSNFQDSATYYEGEVTIAGEIYTVAIFESHVGDSSLVVGFGSNDVVNVTASAGTGATNIPAGEFTYNGLQIIGAKKFESDSIGDPLTTGVGRFTMVVDFGEQTGTYTGFTNVINPTSLNGNLVIDNTNGNITGSNLALGGSVNGINLDGKTASLEGNFHGNGAQSVSGIFYTDDLEYGGGFVGQK